MAKLCQMKSYITNDTDNDIGAANDNAKLNKIVTNNMQHKTYIRWPMKDFSTNMHKIGHYIF